MEIHSWIEHVEKAYETLGKELPLAIKSNLFHKYDEVMEMVDREVLDNLEEIITRFFFLKASRGETFGEVSRIKETYGSAPEENYSHASPSFLKFARTYWTYKVELMDIMVRHKGILVTVVLLEAERNIGSVFFPYPGPEVIWVRQRRETQRQLLEMYAPDIDIKSFLNRNPLLGTSSGPIAQEVFYERVWASCLDRSCRKFFQIPNTVKALRVTCPFCKKTFRFPAKDYRWLNSISPHSHFDKKKANELEKLRAENDILDYMFALKVQESNWCFFKTQEFMFQLFRSSNPHALEKDLWKMVLKSRVEIEDESDYWNWLFSDKGVDDIVQKSKSFRDLCEFMLTVERPFFSDEVIEDIDDILEEEDL